MEERLVLRMMGIVSLAMAAAMLPSLVCALNQEPEMVLPFLGTIFIGFALGAVLAAEYTAQHSGLLTMDDMFGE